jgi:hypothetical protein
MNTAMQDLIEQLTKESDYLTGPDDCAEDKMVGGYIKTIISDIIVIFLEKEKKQIIDAHNNGHSYYEPNGVDAETYYNETFKQESKE